MTLAPGNYRNILAVVRRIEAQCARENESVKLLVVSKTVPPSVLRELYDECGVREFGENRIAELADKAAILPDDIKWHFIGTVQANKIRKIVQNADFIHSIASVEQVVRLDRIAGEEGKAPEFLLEVNVSGEVSKGGLKPEKLAEAAAAAANCRFARWRGLMTMAPAGADDDLLNEIFCSLNALKSGCERDLNIELPELSMGMSGDFPIAIACGATVVRVGSRIFDGVERIAK